MNCAASPWPSCKQKARDTKAELFNLRFALRTGHLTDFSKIKRDAPRVRPNSDRYFREADGRGAAWSSIT